ncbi:hypothetical protein CDAR_59651 [Caerostris darwini]|uniref:Uncharacterized protein n=1 Tax=Caerostris darwini TaxID=1538125 RepID=A0AAV4X455_9ARAC|nr:hypothetical protein CDAR_59651 [Caerostris darwini]
MIWNKGSLQVCLAQLGLSCTAIRRGILLRHSEVNEENGSNPTASQTQLLLSFSCWRVSVFHHMAMHFNDNILNDNESKKPFLTHCCRFFGQPSLRRLPWVLEVPPKTTAKLASSVCPTRS